MSGSWSDPSKWSSDPFHPQNGNPPGTTYDVTVGATGTPYTIDSDDAVTIDRLQLSSADVTLQHAGESFTIAAGPLELTSGAVMRMTAGASTLTLAGDMTVSGGARLDAGYLLASGAGARAWQFSGGGAGEIYGLSLPSGLLSVAGAGSLLFSQFDIGAGAGNAGSILFSGADAFVRGQSAWYIGRAGGHASMRVTDGAVVEPGFTTLGAIAIVGSYGGTGSLEISGGADFTSVHLEVGTFPHPDAAGTGTVVIDGDDTRVHVRSWLLIGHPSGGAGSLILNDGTLTAGTTPPGFTPRTVIESNGTMIVNGGVFERRGGMTIRGLLHVAASGTIDGAAGLIDGGRFNVDRELVLPQGIIIRNGGLLQTTDALTITGPNAQLSVEFGGGEVRSPHVSLADGGRLIFAAGEEKTFRTAALSIDTSTSWLELNEHPAVIDYAPATPSPLQDIRSWIATGYNGGSWNGNGIRSTAAQNNPGFALGYAESAAIFTSFPATFAGQQVDDTAVLIGYTRVGDANLDAVVDLSDFNRLAANFGMSDAVWSRADFNYDGIVNLDDFNRLAANFGLGAAGPDVTPGDWSALASAIPEPVSATTAISGALMATVLRRSRRNLR